MESNPLSKALWESGKASLQQACEEFNIDFPDLKSILSDTIGRFQSCGADPNVPGSLQNLLDNMEGFSMDGAMEKLEGVAEKLGDTMLEIGEMNLDELLVAFELDMAEDLEALLEALQEAQEALMGILELIGDI